MKSIALTALILVLLSSLALSQTIPEPPTNLTVKDLGNGFVKLEWTAPESSDFLHYTIYKNRFPIASTTKTFYYDEVLDENAEYLVKAVNSAGGESVASEIILVTPTNTPKGCDASEKRCFDSIDNDCDGLVDRADSDCDFLKENQGPLIILGLIIGVVTLLLAVNYFLKKRSDEGELPVESLKEEHVIHKPPGKDSQESEDDDEPDYLRGNI